MKDQVLLKEEGGGGAIMPNGSNNLHYIQFVYCCLLLENVSQASDVVHGPLVRF